jgi:hypothetical protein
MNISIDVDLDEVYWDMSKREKKEMAEMLADDGYCVVLKKNDDSETGVLDIMWREQITKLLTARLHLNQEQEDQILQITKNL